jgi:biopolymer transport protein ExbB/TolQ
MTDFNSNFSSRMLLRLIVLGLIVLAIVFANLTFVNKLYFDRQLTDAGLIINGSIVGIFLLGMLKIIVSLLRYMREEAALARVVRHLQKGHDNPLKGVSARSIIAQRYNTLAALGERNARINHSALASTLLANESMRTSFARYVNNILILTGVFGTIVALSIALLGASEVLESTPGSGNMGLVIHGMSTALSTTITAIVCYLFYGYFNLKLNDAQSHLLAAVEEATTVYLLPEFSHDSESMLHEVAGLIHGLRQAAAGMKNIQQDFAEVGSRLHDTLDGLNARISSTSTDMESVKQLLREGFRLPAAGD